MMFAVLGLQEWLFWILRVAAGVGTALIAWLVLGPIIQTLVRIAFHKRLPNWGVAWGRTIGAALLGLLVYYYLPLGGGPGWGPGTGGPSSGKGSGTGNEGKGGTHLLPKDAGKSTEGKSDTKKDDTETGKDVLQIELLGGTRYKGDGRYYLLDRKEPAKTHEEVDAYLQKNRGRYRIVHVVLTQESVSRDHAAVMQLRALVEGEKGHKLATQVVLP